MRFDCTDDLRGILGRVAGTTGVAAIRWSNTVGFPHNAGPQPADALPLLGKNSVRAAGDRLTLHKKTQGGSSKAAELDKTQQQQRAVPCKIRVQGVSPLLQHDMS
jgi:hypothetical protein